MPDTPAKKPMVIAYLTSVYARASDTYFRSEVAQIRALGHTVHTFSIRKPEHKQIISDDIRREHENTLYFLPDHLWDILKCALTMLFTHSAKMFGAIALSLKIGAPGIRNRLWQLAYACEAAYLSQQLRQRGVQHLHHHLEEGSANVALLASYISDIPWSMQVHGPYIFYRPHEWALGEKVARSSFTSCISHFAASQCKVFTPYEHWEKLKLIRVCPDRRFTGQEPTSVPEAPRFVWIGRVCEEKAVPTLIEAAGKLAAQGRTFELSMIGDGPIRPRMEQLIAKLGLKHHVKFTGWLTADQVKREIQNSRALVMPSFAEGLPTVIMEAFALGRPVISTWIAAVAELVDASGGGKNGWLIAPGSVEELAAAMGAALDATCEQLTAMGRQGADRVRAQHHAETEASKLEHLFAQSITQGTRNSERGTRNG